MLPDLLFLLFATILLMAAMGVVSARNPVYCVLFMILAFFNAAGLMILLGAELLGLLLIMVYVGAIAVMFLFVVMTIDVDVARLKSTRTRLWPLGLLVGGILAVELVAGAWGGMFNLPANTAPTDEAANAVQLGEVLFTDYIVPFQSVGLILLIAMVGAIVLTHRRREGVKRQNIGLQVARTREESMTMTQPASGAGVSQSYFEGKGVE